MNQFPTGIDDLQADFMERTAVKNADVLISPSQYMIQWMRDQGWQMPPEKVIVRQNILADFSRQNPSQPNRTPLREFVFFGRLETRKGVTIFCAAIDALCADKTLISPESKLQITFLGKATSIDGVPSAQYIQSRAANWPMNWQILQDKGHAEALTYLRERGRLAVMPSLVENSPYTLLECLGNGIACFCTDLPGNRELISPPDISRITFRPSGKDLAAKLRSAIETGIQPAAPAIDPETTKSEWIAWHEQVVERENRKSDPPRASGKPFAGQRLHRPSRPTRRTSRRPSNRFSGRIIPTFSSSSSMTAASNPPRSNCFANSKKNFPRGTGR